MEPAEHGVHGKEAQRSRRKSRVQVTREGWWIDGRRRILLCASLFYFRVPRELWADRIERVVQAGYHALDVYIPWNYHEPERGVWLFDGDRDVRAFLRLAKEAGLYVIARPGPYICSEWDGGALPAWLYPELSRPEVDPRSQAVFHSGHRTLRQADERFLAEVSRWYDAVFPILREEQLDAGGAVLAVQLDNELDFYPCEDRRGYLSFLKERALAHGITVPLLACSGEDGVSAATGDLEGVVPTANIYSRYRAPRLEERARRVKEELERRNAPLTVTETDRNHFTLRRLLSAGARFLGPYLQVSGHHTGYYAGQNNWGRPSTFLQTDYDFGGMVGSDGELREEFYEARILSGFIAAFEPELVTAEATASRVRLRSAGNAESKAGAEAAVKELSAVTLAAACGSRFVFVPNLEDQPLHVAAPAAATIPPHRVGVLSFDVDFSSRGIPTKLLWSNAEICRVHRSERGLIAVAAYDPAADPAAGDAPAGSAAAPGGSTDAPGDPADAGDHPAAKAQAPAAQGAAEVELVFETGKDAVVKVIRGAAAVQALEPAGAAAAAAGIEPPAPADRTRWRISLSPQGRSHDELAAAVIETGGSRLILLLAPRWLAARAWRVKEEGSALHLGWDWVDVRGVEAVRFHHRRVYRIGEDGSIAELPAEALSRRTRRLSLPPVAAREYRRAQKPEPVALLRRVPCAQRWHGGARYLETLGVYYGAAYYRFHVWADTSTFRRGLWIAGASDAVSFYINGQYLGTALARGRSVWLVGELPWRRGENEIVVRAEIMGHSNFHDTTVPVTHLGSMRGLAPPVILSDVSPGESDYERHARRDPMPSRDPGFIYGAPMPEGKVIETTWELWRAADLEHQPPPGEEGPYAFPIELPGGAWTEVLVQLPPVHPDVPLWVRFTGQGVKGEVWLGERLAGRFWLDDHPDLMFTGGRWKDRIWLPHPWLSGGAITLRLLGTRRSGAVLERIEWLPSTGGA